MCYTLKQCVSEIFYMSVQEVSRVRGVEVRGQRSEVMFAHSDVLCSRERKQLRNGPGFPFTPGFFEDISTSVTIKFIQYDIRRVF